MNYKLIPSQKIYVSKSEIHGLGVFALEEIQEGEIFEICPLVDMKIPFGESSPCLLDYRFNWPQGEVGWNKQVICLGFGSLYNHSENPNAFWKSNLENFTFEFQSTRKIIPNEEILVYYGGVNYWGDGRINVNNVQ